MKSVIGNLFYRVRSCLEWPDIKRSSPQSRTEVREEIAFFPQRDVVCVRTSLPERVLLVETTEIFDEDGTTSRLTKRILEDITDDPALVVQTLTPDTVSVSHFTRKSYQNLHPSRIFLHPLEKGDAKIRAEYNGKTTEMSFKVLDSNDVYSCCATVQLDLLIAIDISPSMTMSVGSIGRRIDAAIAAARRIITEMNVKKNSVAIAVFYADYAEIVQERTHDRGELLNALNSISALQPSSGARTSFSRLLWRIRQHFIKYVPDPSRYETSIAAALIISDFSQNYTEIYNVKSYAAELRGLGYKINCLGIAAPAHAIPFMLDLSGQFGISTNAWAHENYTINEHPALEKALAGLGTLCAGSCYSGIETIRRPDASYAGYQYWNIMSGATRLLGDGLWDVMPGSGLYVDLAAGDTFRSNPEPTVLWSAQKYPLQAGNTYVLRVMCSPNQRIPNDKPEGVKVSLIALEDTPDVPPAPSLPTPVVDNGDVNDPENTEIDESYEYVITLWGDAGLTGPGVVKGHTLPSQTPAVARVTRKLATVTLQLPPPDDIPPGFTHVYVWKRSLQLGETYLIGIRDAGNPDYDGVFHDVTRDSHLLDGRLTNSIYGIWARRPPTYPTFGRVRELKSSTLMFSYHISSQWDVVTLEYAPQQNEPNTIITIEHIGGIKTRSGGYIAAPLIGGVLLTENETSVVMRDTFDQESMIEVDSLCSQNPESELCDGNGCWPEEWLHRDDQTTYDVPHDIEVPIPPPPPGVTYQATATVCITEQDIELP